MRAVLLTPKTQYAIASQIQWHGFSPSTSLVDIHPDPETMYISTERILSIIDEHADSTALLLLPGIRTLTPAPTKKILNPFESHKYKPTKLTHPRLFPKPEYYTGQLFDMPLITQHARARGIPIVGWDLAHAVGNVPLALHAWDVDFAVWCTYKYLNAGPGAVAGAFVHERHHVGPDPDGRVDGGAEGGGYRHRLAGWYGAAKEARFEMEKEFRPAEGAHGWQVSNPSAVDLACVRAALGVFGKTSMAALREKAVVLTGYLEWLLERMLAEGVGSGREGEPAFKIITPGNPDERGSQLSLLLRGGLLQGVSEKLAKEGVVVDVRKPDVIRVAPVPMYCRFEDVWCFVEVFKKALEEA